MRALILEQIEGRTTAEVRQISASQLPAGNVTVDVNWSSLNYKDALAITGAREDYSPVSDGTGY